jgi:hypothetical protein
MLIPRNAEPSYVWGAALDELSRMQPDARIINLKLPLPQTLRRRGINYHESRCDCLSAAGSLRLATIRLVGTERSVADIGDWTSEDQGCRRGSKCLQAAAPALDLAGSRGYLSFPSAL